jgi:hypothetical protein
MMKRAILPLATLILLILLSGCELFIEKPEAGKVYAILVALDYTYSIQDTLTGTLPDARELNRAWEAVTAKAQGEKEYHGYLFLQEGGTTTTTKTVTIGNTAPVNTFPTKANLLKAFENLESIATPNDLIIFTYSGHGSPLGELLLAEEGEKTNDNVAASTFLEALSQVPGRKLMILDTCYSGLSIPESGASHSTLLNNNISKWYKKYWDSSRYTKPEVFVLTASTDTKSYEEEITNEHRHGLFTFALLDALGWKHPHDDYASIPLASLPIPPAAKESILSADSLYTYVKDYKSTNKWIKYFSSFSQGQHPMVSGGALDMVLFTF